MVYDSGNLIEKTVMEDSKTAPYFNASNDDTELDSRSKKKD